MSDFVVHGAEPDDSASKNLGPLGASEASDVGGTEDLDPYEDAHTELLMKAARADGGSEASSEGSSAVGDRGMVRQQAVDVGWRVLSPTGVRDDVHGTELSWESYARAQVSNIVLALSDANLLRPDPPKFTPSEALLRKVLAKPLPEPDPRSVAMGELAKRLDAAESEREAAEGSAVDLHNRIRELEERFGREYHAAFELFHRVAVTREKGDPEITRRFAVVDAWLDALHLVRGEEASQYTVPSALAAALLPVSEKQRHVAPCAYCGAPTPVDRACVLTPECVAHLPEVMQAKRQLAESRENSE